MATTPYDIIAGPADVYIAAVGATVPTVDKADTDSSFNTWTKLGLTQGGVKVKHTQTIDLIKADQRTGPVKAIRSEEGMEITCSIIELTLAKYAKLLNDATVTQTGKVNVITLTGPSAADTFKLTYNSVEGATTFTVGTNCTAAAIQSALRTATSDSGLAVSGTTDAGPFTVTFTAGFDALSDVTVTSASGLTGATTETNPDQDSIKPYQGLDTTQFALLVRGPSPYMNAFLQYEVPIVVNMEEPEAEFVRDNNAMLALKWAAIEDPNASTQYDRFGRLVAQTS